jgi:endopeptidase La
MNDLFVIKELLHNFPSFKINGKFLATEKKANVLLKLSQIKTHIMQFCSNAGGISIQDILVLFQNFTENQQEKEPSSFQTISFYNQCFCPTKVDLYERSSSETKNGILFKQVNIGKKRKASPNLYFRDEQLANASIVEDLSSKLFISIFGAKLYIPCNNNQKVFVISGYFKNNDLNIYFELPKIRDKYTNLKNSINNISSVDSHFKEVYLQCMSLRDILIMDEEKINNTVYNSYVQLQKIKDKNITQFVKEFIAMSIEKQRSILLLLLTDSADQNSIFIANLLFDLIKTEQRTTSLILDSLHWELKKHLRIYNLSTDVTHEQTIKNVEQVIPYEKKIQLMKCSDNIKSKAFEKLKEIHSSKNGESSAKAQQYLDSLLKIPFGIYKKESIKANLDETKVKVNYIVNTLLNNIRLVEEHYILNDIDLHFTSELNTFINELLDGPMNIVNLDKFIQNANGWYTELKCAKYKINTIYDVESLLNSLGKLKLLKIRELYIHLHNNSKSESKKKSDIIEALLNSEYQSSPLSTINKLLVTKPMYTLLQETNEFQCITKHLTELNSIWSIYKENQSAYFTDVSSKLDSVTYGLNEAKNQIKRLIAQWINGNDQGNVFGLEGPPGTGKTTLIKQGLASCLTDESGETRPFVFIPLGGSSNGSTLEGHNYTYVGSTWGRITDGIIQSKCMNPIIYIDEVDKISKTEHGKEIAGILIHITDPAQNTEFMDKYFSGIPLDLSKAIIIFSYNDPDLIDSILLDRIQRIKIEPLSKTDKLMVAKNHLIPEILENIGFDKNDIILGDDILIYIIDSFTYEAGARKLKELLYILYREVNLNYMLTGSFSLPITIDKAYVDNVFENVPKIEITNIHGEPRVGLVNGLYATANGTGGITIIEASKFVSDGHLELKLTGSQGDVMKESMNVAKTLALNLIPENKLKEIVASEKGKFGIHIHCPAGATPKDGPSAGAAITVAIVSLLCNIPVRHNVAITGEIDLTGNILPIGGLDFKVDGGKKAGVNCVLCPGKNKQDLVKIRSRKEPVETTDFKIETINTIYDALDKFLIIPGNIPAKEYFK